MKFWLSLTVPAFFAGELNLPAAVSLPPIFSDNMVVQQDVPFHIWGGAAPGEEIQVSLGEKNLGRIKADEKGRWEIVAESLKPGPLPDVTVRGQTTIVLKNLLAGEVWLCSGQSNMKMTVSPTPDCEYGGVINEEEEIRQASHPEIRFFNEKWEVCSPESVGHASATAYFFGRELQRELKVPVGLVTKAVGGTAVEYWMAPASWNKELTDQAVEAYRPFFRFREELYKEELASYEKRTANGQPTGKKPMPPQEPERYPRAFSKLFELHIAAVAGFPIRGVLWYQGESNTFRSGAYRELLTALIEGWRTEWKNPTLPFVIVQLPNYSPGKNKGGGSENWPVLREKQAQVAATVPHTALAVTLGAGDPHLLHPRNKQEVGRLAALQTLNRVYQKDLPATGPALKKIQRDGPEVVLTFENARDGLWVGGGNEPTFEIAGADKIFQPAGARIEESTVRVSSETVADPAWIRYAWSNNPAGLLYNKASLPAAPFEKEIR